jgi:IS4 transposase
MIQKFIFCGVCIRFADVYYTGRHGNLSLVPQISYVSSYYYNLSCTKPPSARYNNFSADALQIALLYKYRWQIELFFKWIKQHLRIKVFWGESPNAVKAQIWVAVCNYVMIAILKKKLEISMSMNEMLQILSVSALDKTPVNQLFMKGDNKNDDPAPDNQLILFDL